MSHQLFVKLLPAVIASLFFLMQGNVYAAECKGSSSGACSSNPACSWVSGYSKKDGSKVRGYCRTKGKSGASPSKKESKKSDKKSSKKSVAGKKEKKVKEKKDKDKKAKDNESKKKKKKSKDKTSNDRKSK
jgi:hypothetical protein